MNVQTKPKRVFLLDGTALAYRAHFAFIRNPLVNSRGINTSAAFGFTNTLMRILREEKPDLIACAFDMAAPTFRHEKYPDYKATRERMPDELREQLPLIRSIVEAFRIPVVEKEGWEADDVIGTLAVLAEKAGMEVYMVSGDKDLMQLVSSRVKMVVPGSRSGEGEKVMGPDEVKEKLGVRPERVVDLLAMMGDSSDNIPGIPGVGPKTALGLLERFGSLEETLRQADSIERDRLREIVASNAETARLSKELATIHTEIPLGCGLEDLETVSPDLEQVTALFRQLEFNRLLGSLGGMQEADSDTLKRSYVTVETTEALEKLVKDLGGVPVFALDLETTSLNPMDAEIVGLSFSWEEGRAYYIPVRSPEDSGPSALEKKHGRKLTGKVLEALKPLLEDPVKGKCGQNIKYDMLVLRNHGVDLEGIVFDSMVAAYLVNPSARQYNIDALAVEYLNLKKIATVELIGSGRNQIRMDQVPVERVAEYACEDADVAFRLKNALEPRLKESGMMKLFSEVEVPLIGVLADMEHTGVCLDGDLLAELSGEMGEELKKLEQEIYKMAGETFNINSTQQLGRILFEKLNVHKELGKRPRKTKTGYSTDVQVLESLSHHPLPRVLLDYRQLMKLKGTYVDALPQLIHPRTGRVHASFNQTVAATGRLSSSDPNLQNIPVRTELGKEIRKAFVPGDRDWLLLSADYNQIELRIMAHLSGDETLISSFRHGEDVHRRTAAEIFGTDPESVTPEQRRQAKTINFGIMYGMGEFGLAQRLGISRQEAHDFISAYFARYPRVNTFIAGVIAEAYKKGFVTTLLNRRRYLQELKSDNRNIRDFAERTAINTPIQGTAADLIKVAMVRIAERFKREGFSAKMILQIHDELVFEVSKEEIERVKSCVRDEMENAIVLSLPVKVDVGVGRNWLEAH